LGHAVARPREDREKDLLRPALKEIIDLDHPLMRLARETARGFSIRCERLHAGHVSLACRPSWRRGSPS
jgi:hypothetical protein